MLVVNVFLEASRWGYCESWSSPGSCADARQVTDHVCKACACKMSLCGNEWLILGTCSML